MSRVAALLLAMIGALLLQGCVSKVQPVPQRVIAPPIPLQCDDRCTTSCRPATWPRWQCAADDAACWDEYPRQVTQPLRDLVDVCDAHRAACVQCLRRVERVGVVCGATQPCTDSGSVTRPAERSER